MLLMILLCVALERFFTMEPLLNRQFGFNYYFTKVTKVFPVAWQQKPYSIFLFLLPALSVTFLIHTASSYFFTKISVFLVEVIVLFCCLGPYTPYHMVFPVSRNLFKNTHMSLFCVLFWFVCAGPLGALLFRLLERMTAFKEENEPLEIISNETTAIAQTVLGYLSWLPIRFFIAIGAIVGRFPDTLRYWLDHLLTNYTYHNRLVEESGCIALGISPDTDEPLDALQYQIALSFFDKTLGVFLGMLLFYTFFASFL